MIGECKWPLVDKSLKTARLWPIKEYIKWRQDIVVAHVA